jgi:hypothetical protein
MDATLPLILTCTDCPAALIEPRASFTVNVGIIMLRSNCIPFFEFSTALLEG